MSKIITTSWDDGHPKDFLIGELLAKYNLKGTFYIPKNNIENEVMTEDQLHLLSRNNEIGGHTMNHVSLTRLRYEMVEDEVSGCYVWLKEITGLAPVSFCFPRGAYNDTVIKCVKDAGFKISRTTELMSVTTGKANFLLTTTLQVYNHSATTYFKHLAKRFKFGDFFLWMKTAAASDLLKLTDYYIDYILKNEGCFHLWGHSWEIDKFELWDKLELIFKHISNLPEFSYVWNKDM